MNKSLKLERRIMVCKKKRFKRKNKPYKSRYADYGFEEKLWNLKKGEHFVVHETEDDPACIRNLKYLIYQRFHKETSRVYSILKVDMNVYVVERVR